MDQNQQPNPPVNGQAATPPLAQPVQPVQPAQPQYQPVAAVPAQKLTSGSTFLTLEHAVRMALVVALPIYIIRALNASFFMWTGTRGTNEIDGAIVSGTVTQGMAMQNVVFVLTIPAMIVILALLDSRVRAALARRGDYHLSLHYKLPMYGAFAVVAALTVIYMISLVSSVLSSLVLIGTSADIGALYLGKFLPDLLGTVGLVVATWYLYKLLKGVSHAGTYKLVVGIVGGIVAMTLLVTTIICAHDTSASDSSSNSQRFQNFTQDSGLFN